jgi:lipopolysaccharide biosynthesis glycosyltransferase
MMTPTATLSGHGDRDPVAVLAADERFAMPLAATVRSALENLSPDVTLRMFILDGGITLETKGRLVQSWPEGRYSVEWIKVDDSALAGSPVSGHVNIVSYYRILIPRLLPADVHRVIYLDSDLIICADLARLWDNDLAGNACLAAQDCSAPYLDSSVAVANLAQSGAFICSHRPVPNYRALGLPAEAPYFNAGVLLIDLDLWRREDLSEQLMSCLQQNQGHVQWWDQYALNVVLTGRWGQLDSRWNQGSHIYEYPSWDRSPFDRRSFEQLRDDPYIVHFTTRDKPWEASCRHPLKQKFFDVVDRTAWAGWRPPLVRVMLELLKVSERQLRHGRKWLSRQAAQWLDGMRRRPAA